MPVSLRNISPLSSYLPATPPPLIIAGPCSAESEEQVMATAVALKEIPEVAAFRCGLWKPRSRPEDFQGVGEKGLPWLQRVREETGLKTAVEVASPRHIEQCLKQGVDILWIGSRTVVNPFSVDEIAEALRGVDVPVFVKNPVNPDLLLWIGALERLNRQGIRKLAAVHRGFSVYGSKPYRNLPVWEIPLELRRLAPGLPVLIDPSHISGTRAMLPHVAQAAVDLSFDGLMIECHIEPAKALTDRKQQVTPQALAKLVRKLRIPVGKITGDDEMLHQWRKEVDLLDEEILHRLGQRMEIIAKIGKYKRNHEIELLQLERWSQVVEDRLKKGTARGLSRNFLMKLLNAIHEEALRVQRTNT
ncbi:MAG: bifunctional 3-deoxy-7-phosphoheptulonate synthase/chorismate mutase type II [Bacteroidales bacterium]|nr:bifunctional 3-deoxy-7-phosphoheptulonate synthase/chorismate mutase type II [Bacteroidales bacterium]